MSNPNEELAITSWGIVSSIGIGIKDFTENFLAGRRGNKPVSGQSSVTAPCNEACFIPDFDATQFLGKKGTRFLDRTTLFTVLTSGMALRDSGTEITPENQERIGVVLGTNTGSIKSISDFTRDTLVQERPYLVNPLLFPNTVMNCAAGQAAIWHKLKGVNATVSGGRLSGLLALKYAALTIRSGYADALLTGGVEEFCEQTAWGFYRDRGTEDGKKAVLGEGCMMALLESTEIAQRAGRRPMAYLCACETAVYAPTNSHRQENQSQCLATCIERGLRKAGLQASDIALISKHGGDPQLDGVEEEAINLIFGDRWPEVISTAPQLGECFSANGAFQLAGSLAWMSRSSARTESFALLISTGHGGRVGCVILKRGAP